MPHILAKPMTEAAYGRDAYGHEVPDYLVPAFLNRSRVLRRIREVERFIWELGRLVERGEPGAECLPIEKVRAHANAMSRLLQNHLPFLPCDCDSNATECPDCEKRLWTTAVQYQAKSALSPLPPLSES